MSIYADDGVDFSKEREMFLIHTREDIDLAWRLRLYGWSAWYIPAALLYHHRRLDNKGAGFSKLAIISGMGVRPYYRKLGFELDGPYMSKLI